MAKFFYDWEDTTDRHSTGIPDLGRYPEFRLRTKAAVRKDWAKYTAMFKGERTQPKIRVWRVSYEEVTL
jgi:hypothetical protein